MKQHKHFSMYSCSCTWWKLYLKKFFSFISLNPQFHNKKKRYNWTTKTNMIRCESFSIQHNFYREKYSIARCTNITLIPPASITVWSSLGVKAPDAESTLWVITKQHYQRISTINKSNITMPSNMILYCAQHHNYYYCNKTKHG